MFLRVEKISKEYTSGIFRLRRHKVLEEVTFTLEQGETLGLVGESGCGKSTLARTILGLTPPSSGRVFFRGQEVFSAGGRLKKEFCGRMQIVFQHPESALNPRMKVWDSLLEPLRLKKTSPFKEEQINRCSTLLRRVGLGEEYLCRYPHELSGGQIQRIVLARVLSLQPKLLIADEPTSQLDVSVQAQVLRILKDIQVENNISLLFISHDLDVVGWISDRIAVMLRGQIIEYAPAGLIGREPLHPYTRLLLRSYSMPDSKKASRDVLRRSMELDSGIFENACVYFADCPRAQQECRQKPRLMEASDGHYVACWQAIPLG